MPGEHYFYAEDKDGTSQFKPGSKVRVVGIHGDVDVKVNNPGQAMEWRWFSVAPGLWMALREAHSLKFTGYDQ